MKMIGSNNQHWLMAAAVMIITEVYTMFSLYVTLQIRDFIPLYKLNAKWVCKEEIA